MTRPGTLVATANVLRTLDHGDAGRALGDVLAHRPDLVALQEWGPRRRRLLRADQAYRWISPLYGENALGLRRDRYDLRGWRHVPVGWLGWADPGARSTPLLPPRTVLLVRLHDRVARQDVSAVVYHLVPGVQRAGALREDRPRLVARHGAEVRRLSALVQRELARDVVVLAAGDGNLDGLAIPGLVSAWEGRRDDPRGTFGRRKIDDVLGLSPAEDVELLTSGSDHAALLVRRDGRVHMPGRDDAS